MSLGSWLKDKFRTHPMYGAVINYEDPLGGSTEFSSSLVDAIRFNGTYGDPGSIYRTQPAVRICVDFLANNIAPLNIKVFRRVSDEDREHLPNHPLSRLLQHPNPRTTRFDLVRATVSDLAVYDEAYWWKARVDDARALLRVPPALLVPKDGNVLQGPAFYELSTAGGPKEIAVEDIVHFHGYHPFDTRVGLTRLQSLRAVINEDIEASKYRSNLWRRGPQHEGVIKRPSTAPKWGGEGRKRFREYLRNHQSGGTLATEPLVLEDDMDYMSVGFSPKDTEFIAGREWALDMVATAYQIPLALLSRKKTATFASMKEFRKMLYVDVLGPWNAMLEGAIGLQLIPDFDDGGDLYVEFNIDEKLQGDFEEQANAARSAVQVPYMSVDDMRLKRGLPPLGGPYSKPARPSNYIFEGDEPEEPEQLRLVTDEDEVAAIVEAT